MLRVGIFVWTDGGLDSDRIFVVFEEVETRVLIFFAPVEINKVGVDGLASVFAHSVCWELILKKRKYLLSDYIIFFK